MVEEEGLLKEPESSARTLLPVLLEQRMGPGGESRDPWQEAARHVRIPEELVVPGTGTRLMNPSTSTP